MLVPGNSAVRIRIAATGMTSGDVQKREGFWIWRIVPCSEGTGTVNAVGAGVSGSPIGQRVRCYGARACRPFGTTAGYASVSAMQAGPLPTGASFEQGACLSAPGIAACCTLQLATDLSGSMVFVPGTAGAVGACAVQAAHRMGARVIATCWAENRMDVAAENGTDHVPLGDMLGSSVRALAPDGVDHVVEVAFGENIVLDLERLTTVARLLHMRRMRQRRSSVLGSAVKSVSILSRAATTCLLRRKQLLRVR